MVKQNKFKIVIPSYNNEDWAEPNIASIINQTYTNYDVLYIDDASTDKTKTVVQSIIDTHKLNNWKIISNKHNQKRGYNVSPYNENIIKFIDIDEDILVFIDGDDWLIDEHVLDNLNKFYNKHNPWMTYGGMYCYPSGNIGNPQNTTYDQQIHANNLYRKDHWRASHLRTFKWHLYKDIKKKDMLYSKTGKYYFHAEDLATSYPCLEMCPIEKIGVVDFPTYMFNETPSNRARGIERENQAGHELENEIREISPYITKKYIVPTLSGGLCNMMFQIAAAYCISKENSYKLVSTFNHVGTLHTHPSKYRNNIFRNIDYIQTVNGSKISEKRYEYDHIDINHNDNVILEGYFQSYKYINKYKEDINKLFKLSDDDLQYINKYYGHLLKKDTLSIHVRRTNYTNLSQYHANLTMDYYNSALEYFTNKHILVFSDDIEWCKQNFLGDNFTFIQDTDYIELYIMSMCQDNIIANSTFSWWGAWLNKNKNKKVIAPKKWFGPALSHSTNDLIPTDWICLNNLL